VRRGGGFVLFENKSEKGGVEGLEDMPKFFGVLYNFPHVFMDDVPAVMEEV
jgi:hypothetical protein